ncbi:MAG: bifunctional 5,10-methylenetetrahydrofolate dehydrogenase/5,10-methenyltetrahydrofolate cyclohydrolase [Candidatus Eremiobacteraeota bacterium]|nr:bifunctional 5,10-methylenetetrahydrofolate dehydrogenase/5,10-methenyltetrahydrofolate cyclohydrolase [Candidatus Eremiobacteraeota bacterium]MBC5803829.1 bifunctional 5,10-methylenetetrahydrofolate dehydrogenase/5,10-methenyltetrahydrofolate cyclohydrolase [Candidatus Eremiobacteraeota bacterium]
MLDGRAVANELRAGLAARTAALRAAGVLPRLLVVMVGQDESSLAYVRGMRTLGERIGVDVVIDCLPLGSDDAGIRAALERHGADAAIHGIILQQPLPPGRSIRAIADAIPVGKDVDGTNPFNQGRLAFATGTRFVPATPAAVMLLLERSAKWPLRGRDVTVVGRSNVVGLPVSLLIMAQNATVTVTHKETVDIRAHTRRAEIVVVAAGSPRLVDAEWLRDGATVIDVGTTMVNGKLLGDVNFESARTVADEITPVPGGVGPVTNVALMRNVISAAEAALAHTSRTVSF